MKIRIAIVDDIKNEADRLKGYLKEYFSATDDTYEADYFSSAESFLDNFNCEYNIILMDILMSGISGMDASRRVREMDKNVAIMFITQTVQFAIEGYEVDAIDYMLKPVIYEDFRIKLAKVIRYVHLHTEKTLHLQWKGGQVSVAESDVIYVEVMKHTLTYHTLHGNYTMYGTLKEAEQQVSSCFSKCANSYLVNLKHIIKIEKDIVVLSGDAVLPLTRAHRKKFMLDFSLYMGSIL